MDEKRPKRNVKTLVGCPACWDGHVGTVYLEKQTHGIQERLHNAVERQELAIGGAIFGEVTSYDDEGGILIHASLKDVGVMNIEVPAGLFIVVY